MGVQNLIQYGLNKEFQSVYYNRNPDLQTGAHRTPLRYPVGNYYTSPVDLSFVDKVVLAGSPEFFGGPMQGLYEALHIAGAAAPQVLALGIGLGDPNGVLDDLSRNVLSKAKIISRSVETAKFLGRPQKDNQAIVCPALFSSMFTSDPIHQQTLFIVQAPGHGWHEVKASLLDGLELDDTLLCLHVKEFKYFKSLGYKNVRYAATGAEALRIISEYPRVVSTRLHGAIGSLSLAVPSVVVHNGDFRIGTAANMFGENLPQATSIAEAKAKRTLTSDEIKDYKWEQWATWCKALEEIW
jgi:hypothetical protein